MNNPPNFTFPTTSSQNFSLGSNTLASNIRLPNGLDNFNYSFQPFNPQNSNTPLIPTFTQGHSQSNQEALFQGMNAVFPTASQMIDMLPGSIIPTQTAQGFVNPAQSLTKPNSKPPTESIKQQKSSDPSELFTAQFDEKLKQFAELYRKDWKKIAAKFENKRVTPTVVRERYNELYSGILKNRIKFSHREDLLICKFYRIHNTKWELMVQYFTSPRRDAIMLKNRYYAYIRKQNLLENFLEEVDKIEAESGPIENLKDRDIGQDDEEAASEHSGIPEGFTPEEQNQTPEAEAPETGDQQPKNLEVMEKGELITYIKFLEKTMYEMQCQMSFLSTGLNTAFNNTNFQ